MPRDILTPGSDESIVVRAFSIIRRRKAVATVAFATVLAGIVSFVLYLPDLYRASAIVVVERPLADLSRPAVGGDLERRLHVIKQEVLSRDRLTELVKRFNLYTDLRGKMSFEDILNQARNDIHWESNGPERSTGGTSTVTFNLMYTGTDKNVVADVTNTIADFYVAHNDLMRADAAKNQTQLLKKQLETASQELQRREAAMRSFGATNASQLAQATGVNTATYLQLSENLRYVRGEYARQVSDLRRLQELAEEAAAASTAVAEKAAAVTGTDGVAPSKELTDLIGLLDKAKEELRDAQTVRNLAAGHPAVTTANERIQHLEKEIAAQKARDIAEHRAQTEDKTAAGAPPAPKALPRSRVTIQSVEQEMARLKKDEADLEQQMKALAARFEGAGPIQQQYMVLQKEYESARGNFDTLQREYERALQVESVETGRKGEHFRVLDAAIPPEGPAAPNRLRLLIMGLLLALGVAAIAVISAEKLDTSFHSIDDLRQYTTVPVIGTIPRIGPTPARGYARMALGTVSAVAAVVLVATLSAYFANGNEQLVRMLQRAG